MHPRSRVRRAHGFGLILAAFLVAPLLSQDALSDLDGGLGDLTLDAGALDLDAGDLDDPDGAAASGGTGDLWVIELEVQALRLFTPVSGGGRGHVYWYMLYTLENPSNEDREIYVSISATSDRDKTYQDLFLRPIERGIERKLGRQFWGQDDRFDILATRDPSDPRYSYTTLKAGEKRRCIAVFNPLDAGANHIRIDVHGLTNDIEAVAQPDGGTEIREKVRVLEFKRVGDEYEIDQDALRAVDKGWVRRSLKVAPSSSSG